MEASIPYCMHIFACNRSYPHFWLLFNIGFEGCTQLAVCYPEIGRHKTVCVCMCVCVLIYKMQWFIFSANHVSHTSAHYVCRNDFQRRSPIVLALSSNIATLSRVPLSPANATMLTFAIIIIESVTWGTETGPKAQDAELREGFFNQRSSVHGRSVLTGKQYQEGQAKAESDKPGKSPKKQENTNTRSSENKGWNARQN